jgi:bifunctional non-homologous end joining protein LigD
MPRNLTEYRAKRDFTTTSEPSGLEDRPIAKAPHPRFVIQKHDATRLHYDLRLEVGGVFKSWAVTRGPSLDPGDKRLAVEVEDHPLAYGDFEGTIPEKEYGGGTVMIWDRGFWAPEGDLSPAQQLRKGELKLALAGTKLKGSWVLVRLERKAGSKRDHWLLIKHRDKWATPGRDRVQDKDRSVASKRTMRQITLGQGAAPKPFMTKGSADSPRAVWNAETSRRSRRSESRARAAVAPSTEAVLPRLTNPTRALWPDDGPLTKTDLAEYLVAVAPWMIAHLYGRPCSLLRAPEGIGGQQFFQRHPLPGQSGSVTTVTIDRDEAPYLQIDDAQTLVEMAQLSVLEFHPWNCAPFAPGTPGRLVFDLDPAPEVAFERVVDAAKELRQRLETLGLVAFCKTTGGKGLHVVTPLTDDIGMTWEQAKLFAQTVSTQMANDAPHLYLTKMTKHLRTGRIFLDYLRNDATATAVAPLSPRARPGATVSMPLTWAQVREGLDPKRFTIRTAPALLAKTQPWQDYARGARALRSAIDRLVGGAR